MVFDSFLDRVLGADRGRGRVTGPPASSNAASSFHLFWDAPPVPLSEVAVVFELIEPPSVPMLYFWALQVSFMNGPSRVGGAHFGLQHHPDYPANGAVNWGGYADAGGELDGSASTLPSALDNVNTRTYPWRAHRRYRHRVFRSPDRGWRGSVTDLETGDETVVRDLWADADHLANPMVWSEVFAHCDHPSTAVRWTDLEAVDTEGRRHPVQAVRLNYQTHGDGGCANTDTVVDAGGDAGGPGFVQRTATTRTNRTGARLTLG